MDQPSLSTYFCPQALPDADEASLPAPDAGTPSLPADEKELWTADERTYQQIARAVRLFQDEHWRRQNFPSTKAATAHLKDRYPQLRACPLEMKDLCRLFNAFPQISDWRQHQFDVHKLLQEFPGRRQEQRKSRSIERLACREFVENRIRNELLLRIRDGSWFKLRDLTEVVEGLLTSDLALRRFALAYGADGVAPTYVMSQARFLFVKDTVKLLKRQHLVAVRLGEDGEEEVRSTPWQDPRFELDPVLRDLLPTDPLERARLEQRLLREGPLDPLIVWSQTRKLVDGYRRYALYSLVGWRHYEVRYMDFRDLNEVKSWMWDHHFDRRNYSDLATAYIWGSRLRQAQTKLSRNETVFQLERSGSSIPGLSQFETDRPSDRNGSHAGEVSQNGTVEGSGKTVPRTVRRKAAAALMERYPGSRASLYRDGDFSAALDRVADVCGAEIRDKMLGRSLKWTRGDIERLAILPPDEMKQVVQEAIKTGRRPEFDDDDGPEVVQLALPRRQAAAQATLLKVKLGTDEFTQLVPAMAFQLEPAGLAQLLQTIAARLDGQIIGCEPVEKSCTHD